MSTLIFVGLYSLGHKMREKSIDDRLKCLGNALWKFEESIQENMLFAAKTNPSLNTIKGIFVAPEYMVSKQINLGGNKTSDYPIEENYKDEILIRLQAMSRSAKGILFVPGTVAFRKSMERAENRNPSRVKSAATIRNEVELDSDGIPLGEKFKGARTEKLPAKFKQFKTQIGTQNADSEADFKKQYKLAKHVARESDLFLVGSYIYKNQAYVFLNGDLEHKYVKKAGYKELHGVQKDDSEFHISPPGCKTGRKQIGGIHFGFEICFDHNRGVLEKEVLGDPLSDRPEIQIVCSAWVRNVDWQSLADGGYLLHASTERSQQMIRTKTATGYQDTTWQNMKTSATGCSFVGTVTPGGGDLDLFKIVMK